ncbi:hypothetical protein, partial [Acidovorax sp. SUPP2522]|uniref:hypothetical protein n=1 Tax=Acidovorax sp. SUPP2522 TaxID=511900 RepID=UPI0024E13633
GCLDRSLMCISGSSCTPSQRTWTTDPAHQPSAKTEGTEKTLTYQPAWLCYQATVDAGSTPSAIAQL